MDRETEDAFERLRAAGLCNGATGAVDGMTKERELMDRS
jgi:hypothetical protein